MNKNNVDFWRVVAASVTGTSHEKTGKLCQDAHAWKILPGGVLVTAVADGAGSAAMAEVGADIAVGAAVEAIENSLSFQLFPQNDIEWKSLITNALISAKTAVEIEATIQKVMMRDLASTLILLVATPELVAVVQVGDGAAVVGDRGEVIALTLPSAGEYINETTFLISPDAVEKAQVIVWHGRAAQVGILTDGLQMLALKMPEGTPHKPFFTPLFSFVAEVKDETAGKQELVEFLNSPRVKQRTDDDLTILLATLME